MAQLSKTFYPYDPLPAADLNTLVSFMNGIASGGNIEDGAVTPLKRSGGSVNGIIPGATLGTTGNKSITGIGFKPTRVRFKLSPTSSIGTAFIGEGSMDENGNQSWVAYAIATGGQARNSGTDGACAMLTSISSATPALLFSYVSMDADGFTINVTSASSAFAVAYEAEA